MRSTISLIWKEYREQRWFLIAALAIFCGFPLIEATARYVHPPTAHTGTGTIVAKPEFYSDSAAGMVLGCGALLAIFVAIGSTTRDLRDELHVFWRSRPIGVAQWLGTKYAVGLVTVLAACTLPLLMQFWMVADTGRHWSVAEVGSTIGIHSFVVLLVFSVAFLLGCLVRHATHSALLALAAALVIYFLPVVVGPLAPLSVFNLMDEGAFTLERNITPNPAGWTFFLPIPGRFRVIIEPIKWTVFAAAMLGASIAAAALALFAVRRDWRLAADRQAMHWSLGGVALLLFGATAFQLGSNLKVKQQFDLPLPSHTIGNLSFDGTRGVAMIYEVNPRQWHEHKHVKLCTIEMTAQGLRYGPLAVPTEKTNTPVPWEPDKMFVRPAQPGRAYLLAQQSDSIVRNGESHETVAFRTLLTIDLTGASSDPVLHRLDLGPHLALQTDAVAYQHGDTLFVNGYDRMLEIDLAHPDGPTVRRTVRDSDLPMRSRPSAFGWVQFHEQVDAAGRVTMDVPLVPIGDLPPRGLLEARLALSQSNDRYALAGDLLVRATENALSTYRLVQLDSANARFELLGRCEFTPLERLMGTYVTNMTVIDGRVYARQRGVAVFDVTDPSKPRRAGHFVIPGTSGMKVARLADGNVMVVADRSYILTPPKALE
ncbi:MAG: hypothetical protein WBD40_19090 [Tepidisphaeraceae bacterium]